MNRKGFTLVELIATIALLAVISVISFVSINNVIEKKKINNCQTLVGNVKSAAKEYVSDNRYNSEFNQDKRKHVNFTGTALVDEKYLTGEIYDPFSDELLDSDKIKIYVALQKDYTVAQVDILYDEEYYDCKGTVIRENDNNAPVISVNVENGENYLKNNTANIILKDDGIGLKEGTYNIKYGWGTSDMDCASLDQSVQMTVLEGDYEVNKDVLISNYTGNGNLYVCNSSDIKDILGNTLSANTKVSSKMYLDNQGPVITVNDSNVNNTNNVLTIPLVVTDEHSGLDKESFTLSDISVKIGNNTLTSGYELNNIDNNNYNLIISNYRNANGVIVSISEGNVLDNLGNVNIATDLTINMSANNIYTINYDGNGATSGSVNPTECIYGIECSIRNNSFVKNGYTFIGWTTNSDGTDDGYGWTGWSGIWTFDNDEKGISNDTLTLYARWRVNTVTIQYSVNGGIITNRTVANDGTVYNWSTNSDGVIQKINDSSTSVYSHSVNYGDSLGTSGLRDWDNDKYIEISLAGHSADDNGEWKCLSDNCVSDTYKDDVQYTATDFCDISEDSCTITLGVNWTKNTYIISYLLGNVNNTATVTLIGTSRCTYNESCSLTSWDSLGKPFPYSSNGWSFYGWGITNSDTTRDYTDGQSVTNLTLENNAEVRLYAIGYRTFKFYSGIAPSSVLNTQTQYWNPSSTGENFITSITIPSQTDITGWGFLGYRATDTASGTTTFHKNTVGTTTRPDYNWLTEFDFRSIYSRTLTISYNGNGSTSGSTSKTTESQYYNSGIASGGSNSGANVSTPSFTLASNGFSKTGYTFSKWNTASNGSGTDYSGGASYTGFKPDVGDTTTTKTLYAKWSANTYTINYYLGNGTDTAGSTKIGTSTCTYGQSCTLSTWASFSKVFPYSSADTGNNRYWEFYNWGTSSSDITVSDNYSSGSTFTYNTAGDLTLYAIGKRRINFYSGNPRELLTASPYQYWNPYSTSYVTSVTIPGQTDITGWTFYGYVAASDVASSTVTYAASTVGTSVTPAHDAYNYLRSIYSRTVTLQYNKNNSSATGITSNSTATQYFNCGLNSGTAQVSTPSFKLVGNGYSLSGYTWRAWNTKSDGSGTDYAGGVSYTGFRPAVDDTTTTTTLYAKWADITAPGTPTITVSDCDTFTYSATDGVGVTGYYVSTNNTKPTTSSTWVTTTTKDFTVGTSSATYYVWAKDAAGNISASSASITLVKVTRSQGTGSTLTTRYNSTSSSTGTAFTSNPYVLPGNGCKVWAKAEANSGYKNPVLKRGGNNETNPSSASVTAAVTIASSATANTYTITYDANGGSGAPSAQTATSSQSVTLSSTKPTNIKQNNAPVDKKVYKCIFLGWNTARDGSGTNYSAGGSYTGTSNVTLYAQWHCHDWNARGTKIFVMNSSFEFGCGLYHNRGFRVYCTSCGMSKSYYKKYISGTTEDGKSVTNTMDCPCDDGGAYSVIYNDKDLSSNDVIDKAGGSYYDGVNLTKVCTSNATCKDNDASERYCDDHQ